MNSNYTNRRIVIQCCVAIACLIVTKADDHLVSTNQEITQLLAKIGTTSGAAAAADVVKLGDVFNDILNGERHIKGIIIDRTHAFGAFNAFIPHLEGAQRRQAYLILTFVQSECPPPSKESWTKWFAAKTPAKIKWSFPSVAK